MLSFLLFHRCYFLFRVLVISYDCSEIWSVGSLSNLCQILILFVRLLNNHAAISVQSDQRLCCSLLRLYNISRFYGRNFKTLASFCGCADRFVSGLAGNSQRHIFSWRGSFSLMQYTFFKYLLWQGKGLLLLLFVCLLLLFCFVFLFVFFVVYFFNRSLNQLGGLFVCVEVLWPCQQLRSCLAGQLPINTVPGQAKTY